MFIEAAFCINTPVNVSIPPWFVCNSILGWNEFYIYLFLIRFLFLLVRIVVPLFVHIIIGDRVLVLQKRQLFEVLNKVGITGRADYVGNMQLNLIVSCKKKEQKKQVKSHRRVR
jgi:hypothetical protein